jgi:hypothetical protein
VSILSGIAWLPDEYFAANYDEDRHDYRPESYPTGAHGEQADQDRQLDQ